MYHCKKTIWAQNNSDGHLSLFLTGRIIDKTLYPKDELIVKITVSCSATSLWDTSQKVTHSVWQGLDCISETNLFNWQDIANILPGETLSRDSRAAICDKSSQINC